MRRSTAALWATACLAVSTGCGGTAHSVRSQQAERIWIDNTAGVIDQLERDLRLESSAGDTIAAARETLRTGLYTVLVAYTDFGGCRHMVAAAGVQPDGFAEVTRALTAACALFQRSAVLFTRAATTNDPATLLRAGRVASAASPLLVRAKVELQAAATRR
jgi:hypothetical protein